MLLFTHKLHCLKTFEQHGCTFGLQSLGVCEVSYTYLSGYLRYKEKHVKDVCCCLQTCNSVVYVVVMGLVLGQSLMVISTTDILLYTKVSPLYNVLWDCLHVKYTVYQHFGRSLHIESLDPTQVQNFRLAFLTVFETLGFKLKNKRE